MVKLNRNYSDYTDETDPNYPEGKAINATTSESYDGTPCLDEFMNDVNAAHIAMYAKAYGSRNGISGKADTQKSSQFADAIEKFTDDKVKAHGNLVGLSDNVHGATPDAAAGQIMCRDEYGRAKVSAPVNDTDIANKRWVLEAVYPVGSLYWSSKSTNPKDLFGGTWVQIKDRFVWAKGDSDTVNATGGSKTRTLSASNIPKHTHTLSHTHSLNSHTHTLSHTHSLNSHTHTLSHTHSLNSHTHTLTHTHPFEHKHTLAHKHSVSVSGTVSGGEYSFTGKSYGLYLPATAGFATNTDYNIASINSNITIINNQSTRPNLAKIGADGKGTHLKATWQDSGTVEIKKSPTFSSTVTSGDASETYSGGPVNASGTSTTSTGGASTATTSGPSQNSTGAASATTTSGPSQDSTGDASATTTSGPSQNSTGAASATTTTSYGGNSSGNTDSFSIMPPYVVKYCWERTA